MVSPLTMDVDSTEAVMYLTERGLPVYTTVVPNAGLTSPMTLMGTLVVGNAEFLAISVFQQMVKEGTPLIYASLPTVADMRTGAYAPGAIETGMLCMAQAQLGHFYNVPTGGYIGLTNAHSNDAQSGYETGMNTLGAVLAGATLLNMGGLFSSLMAFDFGKAVVDDEIAQMNKRVVRGLEFSEDNLALDVIAAGRARRRLHEEQHTKSLMKTTALFPKVANRGMRAQWEAAGRPDAQSRRAPSPAASCRSPTRPCGHPSWTRASAPSSPASSPATPSGSSPRATPNGARRAASGRPSRHRSHPDTRRRGAGDGKRSHARPAQAGDRRPG